MTEILKNVDLLGALQSFIQDTYPKDSEFADLLEFWLAVDAMVKLSDQEELSASAIRLYNRYVNPESAHFVKSLSFEVIRELKALFETNQLKPSSFVAAQANAFAWLQKQVFPKFLNTAEYKRLRAEIDDTTAFNITIEITDTQTFVYPTAKSKPYTVYVLSCVGQLDTWTLFRRYSELRELDVVLRAQFGDAVPAFPKKKAFGALRSDFVQHRKQQLQSYLSALQADATLSRSKEFRGFFVVAWHARRATLPNAALARVRHNALLAISSRDTAGALAAARAAVQAAPRDAGVAYAAAVAHAAAGEPGRALEWLAAALVAGYANFANLKQEPDLSSIRHMPQFGALLALYPERDAGTPTRVDSSGDSKFATAPGRLVEPVSVATATTAAAASPATTLSPPTSSIPRNVPLRSSAAQPVLAGVGFGRLSAAVALDVLGRLPLRALSDAALVCRRWQLLAYASYLWTCVARGAPRMADSDKVRPRLRRRFFQRALPLLLEGFPVGYTRRIEFLDTIFAEFDVEAISAVYASYNGSMFKTIAYLQGHSSRSDSNKASRAVLTNSSPSTLSDASHSSTSRKATMIGDWRVALREQTQSAQFGQHTAMLLGGNGSTDANFIARPVTSVYTMSQNGFLMHEKENNPLLRALGERTEFVDLVNILLADDALLLVPQESSLRPLLITRHFIQHHIVVLDEVAKAPVASRRVRRTRLYSGVDELELLSMLLQESAADAPDATPTSAAGAAADLAVDGEVAAVMSAGDASPGESRHVDPLFPSTPEPPTGSGLARGHSAHSGDDDEDDGDDDDDDNAESGEHVGTPATTSGIIESVAPESVVEPAASSARVRLRRPLGVATLSGCRGALNAERDSLRFGVELGDRDGGERRYQTLRVLREGKVAIGAGVHVHALFVPRPLARGGGAWEREDGQHVQASTTTTATTAAALRNDAADDKAARARALDVAALDAVRGVLSKSVGKAAKHAKKHASLDDPESSAAGSVVDDDDDDDGGGAGGNNEESHVDLGVVGEAAWRTVPQLVREAMSGAPAHQLNLMTTWAQLQFFEPICKHLMELDREAVEADAALMAQMKRLSFVTMNNLGIAEAYFDSELWETAVSELLAINDHCNPNEKLACILNACRVIIYQLQSGGSAASADDFLPHLIWVVLSSQVPHLHANTSYIRRYCSPTALRMESLYFYTNVEICTSFIMSVEASYLQMDQDEFDAQMAASAPEKRRFSSRFAFLGSSSKANKGNEPIAATARRGANTAEEARSNAAKSF